MIICLLPDTLCTGTGEALTVSSTALVMANRSNETLVNFPDIFVYCTHFINLVFSINYFDV